MSFQAQPTRAGIYQVKVYQDDNRYWNYRAGWIWQERLESTTNFQWKFDPVQGKDTFTISPALDPDVGFIEGDNSVAKKTVGGSSRKWTIKKSADGTYSKIRPDGGNRVLGSGKGRANRVFFEDDSDSARNQRFVFQFVRETQTADNTSTNNNPPPSTNNNPPPSTNTPTGNNPPPTTNTPTGNTGNTPPNKTSTRKKPLLQRRPIVPIPGLLEDTPASSESPDLNNIQGDVYFSFPKKWERFLFFTISDLPRFKKDLYHFVPSITSSAKTVVNITKISDEGSKGLDLCSYGIAFSKAGLEKLDIKDKLQDPHFDKGSMVNEKKELGDMAEYDDVFKKSNNTHGVILLTAKTQDSCRIEMDKVITSFKDSIQWAPVENWEGRVRPGDTEHFGWRDGIAQPALNNIGDPIPGQRVVDPGVIIMGYPGDPVYDKKTAIKRPSFTKDGSFMVFRKLEQNVLYFEDYVEKNWTCISRDTDIGTSLSDGERKALFCARMVGRFKSGVPLARCPYVEDDAFLVRDKINDFDYSEKNNGCPLFAHIRKTEPRNLEPIVSKEFLDASVIIRAGIPYGPEISDEEREAWKMVDEKNKEDYKCNRGLFFVCYQSSIDNGFYRQTTGFANNDFFPIATLSPQKIGQDPIIGGPKKRHRALYQVDDITNILQDGEVTLQLSSGTEKYEVTGVAKKDKTEFEQKFFVTSRGGEYYFVPSISTVKDWGTP